MVLSWSLLNVTYLNIRYTTSLLWIESPTVQQASAIWSQRDCSTGLIPERRTLKHLQAQLLSD